MKKKSNKWSLIAGAFALGTVALGTFIIAKILSVINASRGVWIAYIIYLFCIVGMFVSLLLDGDKK